MRDALRLAFGTLTVLPVGAPTTVDRRTAGRAMTAAPAVGLVLALLVGLPVQLLLGTPAGPPLLVAALAVAWLSLLTRAIHLDGLADTADGLGSGKPAAEALAIMRRSDAGPFGVLTLVLALLLQAAALGGLDETAAGHLAVALLVSRLAVPMACSVGVPGARREGLGSTVAGTVSRAQLVGSLLLTALAVALLVLVPPSGPGPWQTVAGGVAAMAAAAVLVRRCVRRLGGVTGDVVGAAVEVAFTTYLVVAALLRNAS